MIGLFRRIGRSVLSIFRETGAVSVLLYHILLSMRYALRDRRLVFSQMFKMGYESLPLVSVVSIFTGAVASWQAAYQFQGFGQGYPEGTSEMPGTGPQILQSSLEWKGQADQRGTRHGVPPDYQRSGEPTGLCPL